MKTPITYYGGKQAIIHHILALEPAHEVYTESYLGGGSYFWAKKPVANETINDRLGIVVNFYRQLKRNYQQLKVLIDETLYCRQMHMQAKNICMGRMPADELYKAWAFWFTCWSSHSAKIDSGLRYSVRGDTNMAQSLSKVKNLFTELLSDRLQNVCIENREALWILNSRNVTNAFHYQDPPYINADQGHYKGFTEKDFIQLLEFNAHVCKGKFLLSHFDNSILESYVQKFGWQKHIILNDKKRIKPDVTKPEVLVYNYSIKQMLTLFS